MIVDPNNLSSPPPNEGRNIIIPVRLVPGFRDAMERMNSNLVEVMLVLNACYPEKTDLREQVQALQANITEIGEKNARHNGAATSIELTPQQMRSLAGAVDTLGKLHGLFSDPHEGWEINEKPIRHIPVHGTNIYKMQDAILSNLLFAAKKFEDVDAELKKGTKPTGRVPLARGS